MVSRESGMFIILTIAIAIAISGTTAIGLAASVFAGGERHDHDEKNCKNNDDNNCNDKHKTQKNKGQE